MLATIVWLSTAVALFALAAALALAARVEWLRARCAELDADARAHRRGWTLDDVQAVGLELDFTHNPGGPWAKTHEIGACERYFSPWAASASHRPIYFNNRRPSSGDNSGETAGYDICGKDYSSK